MRPRISIRGSVHWSVRPSVHPLVCNQLFSKSKKEGFSSCISLGKPRNITEIQNCIFIGMYACWSVHLSMLRVEKKVEWTHLLVDQIFFFFQPNRPDKANQWQMFSIAVFFIRFLLDLGFNIVLKTTQNEFEMNMAIFRLTGPTNQS